MDIKREVEKLVNKYKTSNPFEICSIKNILIEYEYLGKIMGYYTKAYRIPIIKLNENLEESVKRVVCAHELGHAVLHKDYNTPFMKRHTFFSTDKIEIEANTFAVELLLPDESIYEYQHTNLSIYETCEMYGIPRELAHLKKF